MAINERHDVHQSLPRVVVHIVTFNHAATIVPCLESVVAQEGFRPSEDLFIHLTDNASNDETVELVQTAFPENVCVQRQSQNLGFTGAHNLAPELLEHYNADAIFILNPDVRLASNCLKHLCERLSNDSRCGVVCPKLFRADGQLQPENPARLDSTGMYMTPSIRHFDRGSEEIDRGQYEQDQYVFGASGAAALISKECLHDASLREPGAKPELRLFDDAFFAYREDAELAWRLQWLGWKCRYVPSAIGYHVRRVLPQRRGDLPDALNAYSVRNRFLLQLNNYSFAANWHCLLPQSIRNTLVIVGALCVERSSAPALWQAVQAAPRALRRRSALMKRKRVQAVRLARWFHSRPYAEPALSGQAAETIVNSVHIIVVNYNSGARLGSCLQSLSTAIADLQDKLAVHVTIVDNASTDSSASRVQPLFGPLADFTFIASDENLGFAGGINAAASTRTADALLVLNPDTQIKSEAIVELARALDENGDLGLVAPLLKDEKGTRQAEFSVRSFPSLGSTLAELFFLHRVWPNNPWTSRYRLARDTFVHQYLTRLQGGLAVPHESLNRPLLVPQPAAACILIRNQAFQAIDGFDSSYWPAWFEDVDFCKRLSTAGWLSAVTASAEIVHEGGYSVKALSASRFLEIWYPNLLRYWHSHGTPAERLTLRLGFPIALLLRSIVQLASAARSAALGKPHTNEYLQSSAALLKLACAETISVKRSPK